jgi:hypothetical protein
MISFLRAGTPNNKLRYRTKNFITRFKAHKVIKDLCWEDYKKWILLTSSGSSLWTTKSFFIDKPIHKIMEVMQNAGS